MRAAGLLVPVRCIWSEVQRVRLSIHRVCPRSAPVAGSCSSARRRASHGGLWEMLLTLSDIA